MYVIGLTTESPASRAHRKSSCWRVGSRNDAGESPTAIAPVMSAAIACAETATAWAAGKKVSVVA
jgi:hypothetical protein